MPIWTQVVVREAFAPNATLVTLNYPPWPKEYTAPQVGGYYLTGLPWYADKGFFELGFAYVPVDLMVQLAGIPRTREVQVWLPDYASSSANKLVWTWWQGYWVGPVNAAADRDKVNYDQQTYRLVGAVKP